MSDSTPGEPEDEAGPGSEQVRLFVSDGLIRVGRDATMRQMAQRMAAETHTGMVGMVSARDLLGAYAAAA